MAQHTVTMKAIDSYVNDFLTGSISRGTTLVEQRIGTVTGYWTGSSGGTNLKETTDKIIFITFPSRTPSGYEKKRLISVVQGAYVTARSGSQSGGNFFGGPYFDAYMSDEGVGVAYSEFGWPDNNLNSLPLNQYFEDSIPISVRSTTGTINVLMIGGVEDYTGFSSRYNMSITIQSHSAANPPYRKFVYEDVPVSVVANSPLNNVYVNPHSSATQLFSFTMSYDGYNVNATIYIKQAKIRWREKGTTTNHETTHNLAGNSKTGSIGIAASTFPIKSAFEWQVQVMSDDGIWSDWSPWYSVNTTDTVCYAYPQSPVNEYIDGSKEVVLSWTRSISTGTPANGADFQVSSDGGIIWRDLGTVTNGSPYHAAPNTLPAGNVLWRVRGYNADGVAGPWSEPAAIVVRRAPEPPIITDITTTPQPTVSWQVEGQQAYQLQVGDWDSGTVYGTAKSAQVPYALPDGPTQVRLRIQNSFGLWSDWATAEVTIANQRGEPIAVRTRVVLGGVRLTWTTEGEYPTYAILRDGEEIATVAGKEYTDYTGIGRSRYTVRGMMADSTYTDSPAVVEILRLRSGLLAVAGVWDWMILDRRVDARPAHSGSQEEDVALTWFSGRSLPVAELSGHRQVTARYEYTLPSLAALEKLRAMSGQLVVYKHRDGELFRGLLGGLSWARNRGRWDVSFTITEVDHGPVF